MRFGDSLKVKSIAIVSVAMVVIAVTAVVANAYLQQAIMRAQVEVLAASKQSLLRHALKAHAERVATVGEELGIDFTLKTALKERDRNGLAEIARDRFGLYQQRIGLRDLQMLDTDGLPLGAANDNRVRRAQAGLIRTARERLEPQSGVLADLSGRPVVVYVQPITTRNALRGLVVLETAIAPVLNTLKALDGADYAVVDGTGQRLATTDDSPWSRDLISRPPGDIFDRQRHLDDRVKTLIVMPLEGHDGDALAHLVSQRDETELISALERTQRLTLIIELVMLGLGLGLLFWFLRRALAPLDALSQEMRRIAKGDLTVQPTVAGDIEIRRLSESAALMVSQLRDLVTDVVRTGEQLRTASQHVAGVSDEAKQASEVQQQRIGAVDQAIGEMASAEQEVVQSIAQAAEDAERARDQTAQGRSSVIETSEQITHLVDQVEEAVQAMQTAEGRSQEVGAVLDVINAITEQTNLLALNAAIEAARAGEQGRGFAVVADEVRTLAARARRSTDEVRDMVEALQSSTRQALTLISQSQERARGSVEVVQSTRAFLHEIASAVERISATSTAIAGTAREQGEMVERVRDNSAQIRQLASDNAEGTQRLGRATTELRDLSARLAELVVNFKVN